MSCRATMSCGCGCGGEVIAYEDWEETDVIAAEYQGRKVQLNKPFRTKDGPKKFSVYVKYKMTFMSLWIFFGLIVEKNNGIFLLMV